MSDNEAMFLLGETVELIRQGESGVVGWAALIPQIMQRVEKAVQLAPNDRDVLFLAAYRMEILSKSDSRAKRLMKDYRKRLNKLV